MLGRSVDATTVTGGHQPMPRAIAGHIRCRHAPSHRRPSLSQPTARSSRAATATQRRVTTSLARQRVEQDWTTLVATWRLLSRLVVERHRHRLGDDADAFARDSAAVEDRLERTFGGRWARLRPRLQAELRAWWTEPHGSEPRTCASCRVQNRPPED